MLAAVYLIEELDPDTPAVEVRFNREPVDVDSISGAPVSHQADEPASLIPCSYQREIELGDIGGGLVQRRDAVEPNEFGLDLVCGALHASDLGCYGYVAMVEFAEGLHVPSMGQQRPDQPDRSDNGPREPAFCASGTARGSALFRWVSELAVLPPSASSVMNVRRLEPSDVALVASIDRSEHVEVQYRIEDGRLVEGPPFKVDIPPWDADGSGEHSVASHIAFCASVVADGASLLGAFDDAGELMGLATVHPTFEPGLAWLATLHVSRAHRRRGAASALWEVGAALARGAGAQSLYVSATPTGSAVGFYLSRGCRLADPVHSELFAHEPEDIHLVCPLD
ncbi:MAG TPA: GNAT family N-acetyltransferase [Acidimicrobiales bacterium]|nr:GNAT family N-acetyltransferase [Acidimicrobiales bacterium]